MTRRRGFRLYLAGPARRDIATIDRRSVDEYGEAAALRYGLLIQQALLDLQENPNRIGAKARPDVFAPDVRIYHLSYSKKRVSGGIVREPRHFIVYRIRAEHVEVLRVLHDSRDLGRHVPEAYRARIQS